MGDYFIIIFLGGVISYFFVFDLSMFLRLIFGYLRSIIVFIVVKEGDIIMFYLSSFDGVVIKWKVGLGYYGCL